MSNNFKIATWNARGIRNKKDELFNYLLTNNIQVCLLTETWLQSNYSIKHREFFVYRNDREDTRGGGVAIIIRKNIKHELVPIVKTNFIENVSIKLIIDNVNYIHISACYFPGGLTSQERHKRLFASDLHKLTRFPKYIIGGDLNCRHQSWGGTRANCWGNILFEKSHSYNISIAYPDDPTHIPADANRQASTLDFFLTNIPEHISHPTVTFDLNSDHLPVQINYDHSPLHSEYTIVDYKNANWNRFSQHISNQLRVPEISSIRDINGIDTLINHLTDVVSAAIDTSIPRRSPIAFQKPLPQRIKQLIRDRNYFRRSWQRSRSNNDHEQFKRLNEIISYEVNKFRNKSWNKLLSRLDKGSSPFWNLTKIIRNKHSNITVLKENNKRIITNREKCELLAEKFAINHNLSSNLSDPLTVSEVNHVNQRILETPLTQTNALVIPLARVKGIVNKLKTRKAPGNDGINNNVIKHLPRVGLQCLSVIFNACFLLGYFPRMWKEAKTIPIKKPNKPASDPLSYRPISLLSSLSKILEKIIKDELITFIEENRLLPNCQFGFRKEHNTIHPLIRIRNLVKANFNARKSTSMLLLDIKAAFDSVWHAGLIFKMSNYNFPLRLTKIIQSFLSNRTFKVHLGNQHSDSIRIEAGCPQGSCLSPILYNLYTSDFPDLFACSALIFADDTAIVTSAQSPSEITSHLQYALDQSYKYFSKWNILVNTAKTQAIYFTRRRKQEHLPQTRLTFNNDIIEWEQKVRYLGVILDPKLTFKEHISFVTHKINLLTRTLYPFINRNSLLSLHNKSLIMKTIFFAVIYYGCPVWGICAKTHIKKLQVSQNKILKLIYNLSWDFPTQRLHLLANVELVSEKISRITNTFNLKCRSSIYEHIRELAPLD